MHVIDPEPLQKQKKILSRNEVAAKFCSRHHKYITTDLPTILPTNFATQKRVRSRLQITIPLHDKNLTIAIFSVFNLLLFYAYMFITPNESLPD